MVSIGQMANLAKNEITAAPAAERAEWPFCELAARTRRLVLMQQLESGGMAASWPRGTFILTYSGNSDRHPPRAAPS
jgi:hypothetical protein